VIEMLSRAAGIDSHRRPDGAADEPRAQAGGGL
jgi:hypothetical protein